MCLGVGSVGVAFSLLGFDVFYIAGRVMLFVYGILGVGIGWMLFFCGSVVEVVLVLSLPLSILVVLVLLVWLFV
jgi:hypothetical protein